MYVRLSMDVCCNCVSLIGHYCATATARELDQAPSVYTCADCGRTGNVPVVIYCIGGVKQDIAGPKLTASFVKHV